MQNQLKPLTAPDDVSINLLEAVKMALKKLELVRKPRPADADSINPVEKVLLDVETVSDEILFKARTVFPFDLFPDSIVLDKEKLTIIQRVFFFTARIISVPMRDILSVEADIGPFFGSLHMNSRYFFTNPQSIHFLWRSHALKLQRLLQGYIIATERGIDCTSVNKNHLIEMLEHLGQGRA